MDKMRLQIVRGCDESGNGGVVVDDASAVLGSLPDGTAIVDLIAAAFADAFGVHEVDGQPVSAYRNVSYRTRQYMTELVAAYASKQAAVIAQSQATSQVSSAMAAVSIIDEQ